ncbi:hypothetical protein WJ977_09750 [Achromobacter xylosoxidans]
MKSSVDSEAAVGEKMVDAPWLDALKKALISTGLDSEDLYALLEASIVTEKLIFLRLSMTPRTDSASL